MHLSSDKETAKKVGSRHGKPVIYEIDCRQMAADGYRFWCGGADKKLDSLRAPKGA